MDAILPIVWIALFIVGLMYGIAFQKYHFFPYNFLKKAKKYLAKSEDKVQYGPWSIGIYVGGSPFELHEPNHISNPVLTGKVVTDMDATYLADPFMVLEGGQFYMFFEVWNRTTAQGDIAYAESKDGEKWDYKKIIIHEPFHLSYPYVFRWEDQYYLIPESHEDLSIRLYRATSFPVKWEFVKRIFHGEHYVDPSIFRYNNLWWLFYSNPLNDALNLYFSGELMGDWKPHPMNPVVKSNKHISRPGGRVLIYDGHPYRFAQDTEPRYGIQVFAFAIVELSKTAYKETIVSEKAILMPSGEGWNAYGMHHVDPHFSNGKWIAAVDGKCWPSSRMPGAFPS